MINLNALPCLRALLESPRKGIRKEACWTISNITAGNKQQIQNVMDEGIFPVLVLYVATVRFSIVFLQHRSRILLWTQLYMRIYVNIVVSWLICCFRHVYFIPINDRWSRWVKWCFCICCRCVHLCFLSVCLFSFCMFECFLWRKVSSP